MLQFLYPLQVAVLINDYPIATSLFDPITEVPRPSLLYYYRQTDNGDIYYNDRLITNSPSRMVYAVSDSMYGHRKYVLTSDHTLITQSESPHTCTTVGVNVQYLFNVAGRVA